MDTTEVNIKNWISFITPPNLDVNLSDDIIKEINEVQKLYPNPCP